MGVLLTWALPPTEASWTLVKIERAASKDGTYTEIASQAYNDNTYYDKDGGSTNWYRIRFFDGTSTYSDYSSAIQGEDLTTTYCNPEDVQRIMQLDEPFGGEGSTAVNIQDVQRSIREAEDDIDSTTMHAWREKTITEEMHDLNQLEYVPGSGYPIYLGHRKIKTLDTSEGDKIEIWDGSNWTDWIASSDYTEGRDEDYWMDYQNGILWIRSTVISYPTMSVRVTYRYGESTVPKDIRKACAMMVAMELYATSDKTVLTAEGDRERYSYSSRIKRMEDKVNAIISKYTEVRFKDFGS